jgi:hypothetical protein
LELLHLPRQLMIGGSNCAAPDCPIGKSGQIA